MKMQNFTFTATVHGQTVFGPIFLNDAPSAVVGVNGTMQNAMTGDFSITGGLYITLSEGVDLGDVVYGSIWI
jgi:hypothetical protein